MFIIGIVLIIYPFKYIIKNPHTDDITDIILLIIILCGMFVFVTSVVELGF